LLMELQDAKFIDKHLMDLLFDEKHGLPAAVAKHIKWAFHSYESFLAVDVINYLIEMGEDDYDHIRELREEVESNLRQPKPIKMDPMEWMVKLDDHRRDYRQLNSGKDIDATDRQWHHRIVSSFSAHSWYDDLKYHIQTKVESGRVYTTLELWEEIHSFYRYKEGARTRSENSASVATVKKGRGGGRGSAKGARGGRTVKDARSTSPITKNRKAVHETTRGRKRARSESPDQDRDSSLSPDGHKHAKPKSWRDRMIAKKEKNARVGSERWARQRGKKDAKRHEEHKKDLPSKHESIFKGNRLKGQTTYDGSPRPKGQKHAKDRPADLIKHCHSDMPKSSKNSKWRCKGCKLQDCRGICTNCFVTCNHTVSECGYEKGNADSHPRDSVLSWFDKSDACLRCGKTGHHPIDCRYPTYRTMKVKCLDSRYHDDHTRAVYRSASREVAPKGSKRTAPEDDPSVSIHKKKPTLRRANALQKELDMQ
jgi:hypothetical protein